METQTSTNFALTPASELHEDGQRATVFTTPGLRASSLWTSDENFQQMIMSSQSVFIEEYNALNDKYIPIDTIAKGDSEDSWRAIYFMDEGVFSQWFVDNLPKTVAALMQLPLCQSSFGYCYFSILLPGQDIPSHYGVTNAKLRVQVPLLNFEHSTISVNGKQYPYAFRNKPLAPLVFDDSYAHEVHNRGDKERVVLLFDIWHPDLSPEAIADLSRQFPPQHNTPQPIHMLPSTQATHAPKATSLLLEASPKLTESVKQSEAVDSFPITKKAVLKPTTTKYQQPPVSLPPTNRANGKQYDYLIKMLLVGDNGCGKSSLLLRYTEEVFSDTFLTTIGVDFKIKTIELDDEVIKLQIWDTAGPERFRTITSSYYRGAHGILLMYDVANRDTFNSIEHWMQQIRKFASENVSMILIGTKSDLQVVDGKTATTDQHLPSSAWPRSSNREISYDEGKAVADFYGIPFIECSAKSGEGVDMAVLTLAMDVLRTKKGCASGVLLPQYEQRRAPIQENSWCTVS